MNSVKVPWQPTKAGDLDLEVLALRGRELKMLKKEREREKVEEVGTDADTQLALIGTEVQTAAAWLVPAPPTGHKGEL